MKNFFVIIILAVIIGAAVSYVIRSRKKGVKCIGCPSGNCCSGSENQKCSNSCFAENTYKNK